MNNKNTLLAWYIFVEDPRSKVSREAINEFQVHLILLNRYPAFLSIEEIATNISSYPGCFSMSDRTIEGALNNSLKRTPPLIAKSGEGYQLTEQRKKDLEKAKISYKESQRIFEDYITLSIEKEYGEQLREEDKERIKGILEPILVEFFNKRVLELDRVRSVPKCTMDASFEKTQLEEWDEVVNKHLAAIDIDRTKKAVAKVGIKNALFELPLDGKRYIAAVHNKVFCAKFAVPDPLIIQMEKKMLAERRLYLDTNIVIKAVFEDSREHKICKELLDLRNEFNLQIYFSDFTKEELDGQREKAKKITYIFEKKKSLQLIQGITDTDIVRTYLKRKLFNPSLTIDSFLSVYDSWDEYLFERYGILYESEFCEETQKLDVSERDLVKKHIKESKTRISKSKYQEPKTEAVEHDVNEFLLGHLLREKYPSDEFGSKVWIITTDRAITTKGQKYLKFKYPKPIFKLAEEWLERLLYITMVELECLSIEKYIDLIVDTELGAIYEDPSLDIDFTVTLLDSDLPIEELRYLAPDHASRAIAKLQADKEVGHLIEKANTVPSHELPEIHELFRDKLLKAVHDEKEYTQKMETINLELKQMRENIQSLTETLIVLKKEIEGKNDLIGKREKEFADLIKKVSTLEKKKDYLKYGVLILGFILILLLIFTFSNIK